MRAASNYPLRLNSMQDQIRLLLPQKQPTQQIYDRAPFSVHTAKCPERNYAHYHNVNHIYFGIHKLFGHGRPSCHGVPPKHLNIPPFLSNLSRPAVIPKKTGIRACLSAC